VVIPIERAAAVAREVVQKIQKESQRIAAISEGVVSPAWLDEAMERVGIVNR
jgi:4-hydroxy-4-methyl-2-oxoglutarate aldolase